MKTHANSYKIAALAVLLMIAGCKGEGRYGEETSSRTTTESSTTSGFDALELPQDSRIIPNLVPKKADVKGAGGNDTVSDTLSTARKDTTISTPQYDTLASQALRIQIYATEVFGDAKKEHRIASEIFDQPVYLDYEVPYYKVRVGSFADRKDAEAYLYKAKRVGYNNAWVVAVRVNTKEAEPLYEDLPVPVKDSAQGK